MSVGGRRAAAECGGGCGGRGGRGGASRGAARESCELFRPAGVAGAERALQGLPSFLAAGAPLQLSLSSCVLSPAPRRPTPEALAQLKGAAIRLASLPPSPPAPARLGDACDSCKAIVSEAAAIIRVSRGRDRLCMCCWIVGVGPRQEAGVGAGGRADRCWACFCLWRCPASSGAGSGPSSLMPSSVAPRPRCLSLGGGLPSARAPLCPLCALRCAGPPDAARDPGLRQGGLRRV